LSTDGIDKNFKLMVLEVVKQVEDTQKALENSDPHLISQIDARDDYIDNLKSIIENKCFYSNLHHDMDKKAMDLVRSVNIISNNLERIADLAVNIVSQIDHLPGKDELCRYEYKKFFELVLSGMELINKSLEHRDISRALKICQSEFNLDALFASNFNKVIADLRSGEDPQRLVTLLFILNYLERMGDSLLNIGEAIIFAVIGEKMKIHDFEALEDSIEAYHLEGSVADMAIESYWGTRSGCRISRVQKKSRAEGESQVIFKEGRVAKLEKERDSINLWSEVKPGLPPKVFSFQKNGKSASILLEFLDGLTFQQILMTGNSLLANEAFSKIKATLLEIWTATRKDKPTHPGYMKQCMDRAEDIYKVHPEFHFPRLQIGSIETASFSELAQKAVHLEKDLNAPFSVLIHGDFNIDNIIYNDEEKSIRFIDLYRSKPQDYIQDVSVFMISNFRQPVFVPKIRSRLNDILMDFYFFSRAFAEKSGDETFHARLILGLIRSFLTSTRFELNKEFAWEMHLRAVYLLEKFIEHRGKPWKEFRFSPSALIY